MRDHAGSLRPGATDRIVAEVAFSQVPIDGREVVPDRACPFPAHLGDPGRFPEITNIHHRTQIRLNMFEYDRALIEDRHN